jgi:phospholipid transport system transporter-binding protein
MSDVPSLGREGDVLFVAGDLTMQTVSAIVAGGAALMTPGPLRVDLSRVGKADSAGLALLLDWFRSAIASSCNLVVVGAPADLATLARVYGLSDILPMFSRAPAEPSRAR